MIDILAMTSPLEEIASRDLFTIGAFRFTNHMLVITLAFIVLLIVLPLTFRRRTGMIFTGFGNAVEAICLYIREEMVRPFLGQQTDKYITYIWTLFFFILTMNLMGMIPLDKMLWFATKTKHLGGAPTANIYITGALALCAFIMFHVAGMIENGFWSYWKNFTPKVPAFILPFMFLMELVSSFVRMFSLALRLFANILAGHVLLATLVMLILMFHNYLAAAASTIAIVVMSFMELFVAFLQTYIFTFLTTIFIGMAIHQDH